MAPILGIWASAAQPPQYAGSFESIATVTVGSGGAADVTFSSIPGTYTHLQVRGIFKGDSGTNSRVRFNGDTGSNYASHFLNGNGSSASAAGFSSLAQFYTPDNDTTYFSAWVLDVLDYANTNKYKTMRLLGGFDANGSGVITLNSGLWQSTSAITSLKIYLNSGNISQYSHFALYGIK